MKAVLQAAWHLTSAIGNVIVVIIAQINIGSQVKKVIKLQKAVIVGGRIFPVWRFTVRNSGHLHSDGARVNYNIPQKCNLSNLSITQLQIRQR